MRQINDPRSCLERWILIDPDFMARMREGGIACLTYSKYPGDDWPVTEFARRDVRLASGQKVTMQLAERGTLLGRKLWVREVRKLSQSGHQTSIIATDVTQEITGSAAAMFARWSQEKNHLAEFGGNQIN